MILPTRQSLKFKKMTTGPGGGETFPEITTSLYLVSVSVRQRRRQQSSLDERLHGLETGDSLYTNILARTFITLITSCLPCSSRPVEAVCLFVILGSSDPLGSLTHLVTANMIFCQSGSTLSTNFYSLTSLQPSLQLSEIWLFSAQ